LPLIPQKPACRKAGGCIDNQEYNSTSFSGSHLYTHPFLLSSCCDREIPLPLKRFRDDRLFYGTLDEEATIRIDILFMKYFTLEWSLLHPANQLLTCHPERQRGISFSLSAFDLN
jgi:hypothetical protein